MLAALFLPEPQHEDKIQPWQRCADPDGLPGIEQKLEQQSCAGGEKPRGFSTQPAENPGSAQDKLK
jgi:hypothetical protein